MKYFCVGHYLLVYAPLHRPRRALRRLLIMSINVCDSGIYRELIARLGLCLGLLGAFEKIKWCISQVCWRKKRATIRLRLDLILRINLWEHLWHFHCSGKPIYIIVPCPKGDGKRLGKRLMWISQGFSYLIWRSLREKAVTGFLSKVPLLSLPGLRAISIRVERNAGDWISFACTPGILEKCCCNFWSVFCVVPSQGSHFDSSTWCSASIGFKTSVLKMWFVGPWGISGTLFRNPQIQIIFIII